MGTPNPDIIRQNNLRILTNTLMLYVRMAFVMGINFFTTRELLLALGERDYGLVNVIGGVVSLFSFFASSMTTSVTRFFNYEIGKGDSRALKNTFNLVQIMYGGIVLALFILSETVGVWVFENKLDIPAAMEKPAFEFFQYTVATFLIGVFLIPYEALIISRENMKVYSIISVSDAVLKLLIVYLLYLDFFERISFYGMLLAGVMSIKFFVYAIYNTLKYKEACPAFFWDWKMFKEIFLFGAWNIWGGVAWLFSNTLVSILLNNFFGAAVNVARAVAVQVSGGVSSFTTNFLLATNPQIVKYWAEGNLDQCRKLTLNASRLGFFLVLIFAVPLIAETEFVLKIWLKEVPEYGVIFTRLVIIQLLIDVFSFPLMTIMQASGRIALYQITVGLLLCCNFPLAYICFKSGYPPESALAVGIFLSVMSLIARLGIAKVIVGVPFSQYIVSVILPSFGGALLACGVAAISKYFISGGWRESVCVCFLSVLGAGASIFLFGLSHAQKKNFISSAIVKLRRLGMRHN